MNPPESGEENDDEHCYPNLEVTMTASNLDVYRRERLAYTETPSEYSSLDKKSRRLLAIWKAVVGRVRLLFDNQPQSRFAGHKRKHEHTD